MSKRAESTRRHGRFQNWLPEAKPHGFKDVLKWQWTSRKQPWPREMVRDHLTPDVTTPLSDGQVRVTVLNHVTVLIQSPKVALLTDPVLLSGLGPMHFIKRYREPGLKLEQLPPIDALFVSHNHYDHLDVPTIQALCRKQGSVPKVFVPLGMTVDLPKSVRSTAEELDWWQTSVTPEFRLTSVPALHWSRRRGWDTNRSLWCGMVLELEGMKIYFAGDTGYADHFTMIHDHFGAMDLSLLPIGAYEPRWFMKVNHMNPADAVQAHRDLHSLKSLGVHHGTFRLTDEGIDDPANTLRELTVSWPKGEFEPARNGTSVVVSRSSR